MPTRDLRGSTVSVLGAGGFIGINVCAALSRAGAIVRGFGHRSRFTDAAMPEVWFEGDFSNGDAIRAAVKGADFVVHLLGGSNPAQYNNAPIEEVSGNLIPSLSLFKECCDAGVSRVIFLSSGGTVYGPDVLTPTAETAPTNPISAYGVGKLSVEKYLGVFHHLFGLDYRILRVSNPFGPFQAPDRGQGFIARAMWCALHDEPVEIWGDGLVVRDYIYVGDVAAAVIQSLSHTGCQRTFNIGSNRGLSLLDVVASIERAVRRSIDVQFLPSRPADIPSSVLDITKAGSSLGWQPKTDFDTALELTKSWLSAYRVGKQY